VEVTAPDGTTILDFVMPETVNGRSGLAHNPVQPHTVRGSGEVRTCVECHRAPAALGLGSGNYSVGRDYAFIAGTAGISVFDRWEDPVLPSHATDLLSGSALGLASIPNIVSGRADYLYVASGPVGLVVFDLRDGLEPVPAKRLGDIDAIDVSYAARYLYVAVRGVGVYIYDVADPTGPVLTSSISIPTVERVVPWGIHLLVASGSGGLTVVDIADHTSPFVTGGVGGMNAVDVTAYAHFQGGSAFAARAYVADPDYGVHVVDLLPEISIPMVVDGLPLLGAAGLDTYTRYFMRGIGIGDVKDMQTGRATSKRMQ